MISYWTQFLEDCEREVSESVISEHEDIEQESTTKKEDDLEEGRRRFQNATNLLTTTRNIRLLPYQLSIAKDCIVSSLAHIYGESCFNRHKNVILEDHRIAKPCQETFVVSARRVGKTLTVSMTCLAIALSVPAHKSGRPFRIAVYSVTLKSAKAFIQECILNYKSFDAEFTKNFSRHHTSDTIVFTNKNNPNDVRIIETSCGRGHVSNHTAYQHYTPHTTQTHYTTHYETTLTTGCTRLREPIFVELSVFISKPIGIT